MIALAGLAMLFVSANAGETVTTKPAEVSADKTASVLPVVKEHLCGGCTEDEGLTAECWFEGDICLERDDVRKHVNARFNRHIVETFPRVSKSEFVLMVYMVDYLFRDGAHLSSENLAALADQEICPEINIDCLSRTVHRVLSIDPKTIKPSTR